MFIHHKINEDIFNRHEDIFITSPKGDVICLYTAADAANQWPHICRVYRQARRIVDRELNEDEILAVLFHDAAKNRQGYPEDHGVGGAIFFRELAPCLCTPAEHVYSIASAIERHTQKRHSGSNLGELLRSADMPEPNFLWYARKCYHKMRPKLGHKGALENAFQRTLERKMLDGAPSLYLSVFGEILERSFAKFQRITSAEELGKALQAWEACHPQAPKNS